jgi:hypothetical protein
MVRIGQNNIGAYFFKLPWCDSLYRTSGADRAEGWRLDLAMTCR